MKNVNTGNAVFAFFYYYPAQKQLQEFISFGKIKMITAPKVLSPRKLAYRWVRVLGARPNMRKKRGRGPADSECWGELWECFSTEQSVCNHIGTLGELI